MATGIIRIENFHDIIDQIPSTSTISAGSPYDTKSSSSGISSSATSPHSYTNEGCVDDNDDKFTDSRTSSLRSNCVGVLNLNDELRIDFEKNLPKDMQEPPPPPTTWRGRLIERIRSFHLPWFINLSTSSSDLDPLAMPIEESPKPSCTLVYAIIFLLLFAVLVVGAVTTIVDLKPEFLFGKLNNATDIAFADDNSTLILPVTQSP